MNIMKNNRFRKLSTPLSAQERGRRKRELILIPVIIGVVALLTYAESRIIYFGSDFPISNTILMFILININLLLLLLLLFLVFRNVVKLFYERKRKVAGAKLRTRLVVAFITLTLLPTTVLFFFAINFITTSIEFWFNVPVEQALENSLRVGRRIYDYTETNSQFYMERIAYQIKARNLLDSGQKKALERYILVVQRSFNLEAVEVYSTSSARLAFSVNGGMDATNLASMSSDDLRAGFNSKPVRSVSMPVEQGEMVRTIGTVPYGSGVSDAQAFVVLSVLIPMDLSEDMASISRGFEEYQQIKLLQKPIQATYYITLSIVALLVLFCAAWFGFYLAKTISIPIMELAEGTRKVAEGDLRFTIGAVADDEIGILVDSFNKMTRDLRIGREQLEISARMLRDQNIEIEEKRRYMEIVLKNVSAGVITLDAGGFIATVNKSAEKMLNIDAAEVLGKSYKRLLRGPFVELAREIMDNLADSADGAVQLPLKLTIDGHSRSFLLHVNALNDDAGNPMGIVMVFDDLTELEKAQRMAAWREVARRIAHEVKNPLTPISLSAQRLKRKYSHRLNEPVFDECTRMIIDHVELIRNLVNEFSNFARLPTANPLPCELAPLIEETVALYKDGPWNIRFEIHAGQDMPRLNLDRQLMKRALINLVDNAVAAIGAEGSVVISASYDPILKIVRIEVSDTGPGISDEDKTHLFEPYFSTKKSGMGLGLSIVNGIISDHNGRIYVQDNSPQGARFVIELPVS